LNLLEQSETSHNVVNVNDTDIPRLTAIIVLDASNAPAIIPLSNV